MSNYVRVSIFCNLFFFFSSGREVSAFNLQLYLQPEARNISSFSLVGKQSANISWMSILPLLAHIFTIQITYCEMLEISVKCQ